VHVRDPPLFCSWGGHYCRGGVAANLREHGKWLSGNGRWLRERERQRKESKKSETVHAL
jgi:hypothetical protein